MLYFAYGSNMYTRRLNRRVPGAVGLGAGILQGHELRFHKAGMDGSAKCDAFSTGKAGHAVHGVLFSVPAIQQEALDRAEGPGYERCRIEVRIRSGTSANAFTYLANDLDPDLRPFGWYLGHVLAGAREWSLPLPYIEALESVAYMSDCDRGRAHLERGIH